MGADANGWLLGGKGANLAEMTGMGLPVPPGFTVTTDACRAYFDAGAGFLMRHAVREGRAARPDLELGLCGEHGADAASVALCAEMGLDYVSCSPFRVPVARLARSARGPRRRRRCR